MGVEYQGGLWVQALSRNLAIGFWLLFGASIALHFWIGGVVVETKYEAGQNYILLRDDRTNWVPVSTATSWAHFVTKYTMFAACLSAAVWAAWRWPRHGNFKN